MNFDLKKLPLYLSIVALLLSLITLYFASSSSELVYVDVNKLMDGYKKTKTVKADFDKKSNLMKSNIDTLISKWQIDLRDYEKNRTNYTSKELKLKQELINTKQQQITDYQKSVEKKILEEGVKSKQSIVNDINDFLKEFGKKKGYKIIFGASGGGNIMFADSSTDLTEEVLNELNNRYDKN